MEHVYNIVYRATLATSDALHEHRDVRTFFFSYAVLCNARINVVAPPIILYYYTTEI